MKAMIITTETLHYAGAERMLEYFLEGLGFAENQPEIIPAICAGTRLAQNLACRQPLRLLPSNQVFTLLGFARQLLSLSRIVRLTGPQLLHAWTARDWELTAITGRLMGLPVCGTLHDHPLASFISGRRQRMMRFLASGFLDSTIAVSDAVRVACVDAGYPYDRVRVIRNGLPAIAAQSKLPANATVVIGFLGVFSERKGFTLLFEIFDLLAMFVGTDWRVRLAGSFATQAEESRFRSTMFEQYRERSWWVNVEWCGWIPSASEFLSTVNLLLVPSADFDPFPTVLLEAARSGVPVVASKVGGVAEIVHDGQTGWLFAPGDCSAAARILAEAVVSPACLKAVGSSAAELFREQFGVTRMVCEYSNEYAKLTRAR